MSESIRISHDGPVTIVEINRPRRRNAVDGASANRLFDVFKEFDADASASVAVFCGAGDAFCAGADLKALAEGDREKRRELGGQNTMAPMGPSRLRLGKPVIAAIEGPAVAGGMELAIWADLRVMAETAFMGVFCRRWGVPLIDGGTVRLPRLVGEGRAMDLILTGRRVDAEEALVVALGTEMDDAAQDPSAVGQRAAGERLFGAGEHGLEDRFVFLYTGTLGMKHNPDLLLQLGSQYRQDPNVRIVVISEGIGAEWLLRRCQDEGLTNIAVYPYQPFEQMPSILASGDLLISVLEADAGVFSVPSKVLTYFCAGRAQLAAVPHDNLVTRLIGQAGAGITVDPSDVGAFLEAANLLKGAASQRIEMGQKGRKYAEATFAIDRIASEFEDVFNNSR